MCIRDSVAVVVPVLRVLGRTGVGAALDVAFVLERHGCIDV